MPLDKAGFDAAVAMLAMDAEIKTNDAIMKGHGKPDAKADTGVAGFMDMAKRMGVQVPKAGDP